MSRSKFYGLELIDAPLPAPNHGHVVLGAGAPVLLYQIGTHETRALIDVPEGLASASVAAGGVKSHLRNVVLPDLPSAVRPSFEAALDEGKLRSMPNSWLPPSTNVTAGLVVLGDALNMRHPLTGGGMTVAFNDVVILSELLDPSRVAQFDDTQGVLAAMRTWHWRRKRLTSVINILAQALYALFAADGKHVARSFRCHADARACEDPQLKTLQRGCFRYFQLGGAAISGPIGLLGGIIRNPFVLFYHFFAVALFSIWIFVVEGVGGANAAGTSKTVPREELDGGAARGESKPVPGEEKAVRSGASGMIAIPSRMVAAPAVFWKACLVLFPYIFSELRR